MKFATEEELKGHHDATVRGSIEGFVGGFGLALPLSYLAHRKWPAYRAMPIQLKALGVILIVLPAFAIQAERRGVEYDESTWTGAGKQLLDREEREKEANWEHLSTGQKIKGWAAQNQYKVILGGWASSMALAGGIIMRNKYQTMPQKVVQARMWAQALTIGVLIAAGVLTHAQRVKTYENRAVDHSWREMLEEEETEQKAEKKIVLPTRAVAPVPAATS